MIYFNNAATSYPKPEQVTEAVQACIRNMPASQFRGGAQIGQEDIEDKCKQALGKLLGISAFSRIFFTSGATESLNSVLCGLELEGDILVTQTEHNSVLRPLLNQQKLKKTSMKVIPCTGEGEITPDALNKSLSLSAKALVINHCSNVTGKVQDMEMISSFARDHGLLFIADVSQSAGCLPVDADAWGADALIFTGHKSLLGIQGTGGFYIRPGLDLIPLKFGGTGTNSAKLVYGPSEYEYEPGTQNLPGITGLLAGVQFIEAVGIEKIAEKERRLMRMLYEGLARIPGLQLYGTAKTCQGPVMSLNFPGLSPSDAAYILWSSYGIVVRAGLHCSPLIHEAMGTAGSGTVRISVSYFSTDEEVRAFLDAAAEIMASLSPAVSQ